MYLVGGSVVYVIMGRVMCGKTYFFKIKSIRTESIGINRLI